MNFYTAFIIKDNDKFKLRILVQTLGLKLEKIEKIKKMNFKLFFLIKIMKKDLSAALKVRNFQKKCNASKKTFKLSFFSCPKNIALTTLP